MTPDSDDNLRLEIGHVLFLDIVGYSKLLIDEQKDRLRQLTDIVLATSQVTKSSNEQLVRLPTGDGMALVFRDNSEEPAQCAVEIAEALKKHPELSVRMGIHSGPVSEVTDVNGHKNIAGAGINLAQRVMDCGDAGHILLSQRVADDLAQYRQWAPRLHDLGECEVKHGVRLHLVNLYLGEVGNPAMPAKLASLALPPPVKKSGWSFSTKLLAFFVFLVLAALAILALIFAPAILHSRSAEKPSASASPHEPAAPIPAKSIAVLPFENLSDNKENAYFADGVQDEILTDLAKVADLKVISRTSVMQYRDTAARNLRKVGEELGVANVLEGSVQRAGAKVRINAQLIDARNDTHLWAQSYDRDLADVFAIQTEIAQTIAEQLQAKLSPTEKKAMAKPPTTDLVAYDLYLRAQALDDLANDPQAQQFLEQAVALLEEAVRRDPHFLLAYCLLNEVQTDFYWGGFDHSPARLELAQAAIAKAEEIDPDAGEVHLEKGMLAYHGYRDYEGARREFALALRTLPNSSHLAMIIGAVDRRQGRWEDAVKNFARSVELSPRNPVSLEETGFTFVRMRRYPEATSYLGRMAAVNPNDLYANAIFWNVPFFAKADTATFRAHFDQLAHSDPKGAARIANVYLDCALAERDRTEAGRALALIPAEGATDNTLNNRWPHEWYAGLVARSFGDAAGAQKAFTAARALVAPGTQTQPDYAGGWIVLGLIDAGLGHKSDAIAEGRRACELIPISQDAFDGPYYARDLAQIYAWVGEKDLALEQLAISAKVPGGVAYGDLKLLPAWDSLRGDPRFEQIVASLAPQASPAK